VAGAELEPLQPYVPNERLVVEAYQKRQRLGGSGSLMTDKGRREIGALFALRESIGRGEQPEGVGKFPIENCVALSSQVDSLLPPSMKGTE